LPIDDRHDDRVGVDGDELVVNDGVLVIYVAPPL